MKLDVRAQSYKTLFDTIEFPEAYRITFLAGSIAGPAYRAIERDLGLIRAEYVLLACLSHFPTMTAQDVAYVAQRPRNTVSRAVHRMVAEGYIERAPDMDDARQAKLKITDAGRALHLKAAEYLKERQDLVLSTLEPDERRQFANLLRKVVLGAAAAEER